jgi:hypothetical protein
MTSADIIYKVLLKNPAQAFLEKSLDRQSLKIPFIKVL